jgi:hypothetical protein
VSQTTNEVRNGQRLQLAAGTPNRKEMVFHALPWEYADLKPKTVAMICM